MASGIRAPSTIITVNLTGQTEFDIPFEYLARKYVVVTLLGTDRKVLTLNTDYRFVSKTRISLVTQTPAGYTQLELRRVTSAKERLVDFYDGSILRASDLNVSQIQTLHVAEEARDWTTADGMGLDDDFNYNARNKRIVNLAPAINRNDAVSLGQIQDMENGAYQSAVKAAGHEAKAKEYADEAAQNAVQFPSIKQFGAIGNGVTDDTEAFREADASGLPCYVPAGVYKVDAPAPTGKYFGIGRIAVAGIQFELDVSIPTRINTGVSIDPEEPETLTQDGRYMNLFIGQRTAPLVNDAESRASVVVGYDALSVCPTAIRLTGVGKQVFHKTTQGYTCEAFGSDALGWGEYMERCTALGSNALKWAGSVDPVGAAHDYFRDTGKGDGDFLTEINFNQPNRWPTVREYVGSREVPNPARLPTKRSDVSQSVAVGRNALLHATKSDSNVAVGVNSLAHLMDGKYNVGVGTRALRDCLSGNHNTGIGNNSSALLMSGVGNVSIGSDSLSSGSHVSYNVAIGFEAAKSLTGTNVAPASSPSARRNTYIGTQAGSAATDGSFNVAIGAVALKNNTAGNNTAVGVSAMESNVTGSQNVAVGFESLKGSSVGKNNVAVGQYALLVANADNNTAVGHSALRYTQSGGSHGGYANCTGIGYDARVSDNNQVQLGNSETTTYVYGTVQNRSDARDKIDVEDTTLGIDFVLGLRAVEGRWNMRDDYIESDADGVAVANVNDGSKARKRKHQWFIAQEVKELCDKLGVDFGGYQDHSISGGEDVLTLGYDEFIPPVVKAVQDCWSRMDALEKRIEQLEGK